MIYETNQGAYLFGFDTVVDTACVWDQWYESIEDADEYSRVKYGITNDDWIEIAEPALNCRHDFIQPTKIGTNGYNFEKIHSFGGLTGNERLFISGPMDEFEKAKLLENAKAKNILTQLGFDTPSIKLILS